MKTKQKIRLKVGDIVTIISGSHKNKEGESISKYIQLLGTGEFLDSKGNVINEPYPTAFASGGFDLDGVGVVNEKILTAINEISENIVKYADVIEPFDEFNEIAFAIFGFNKSQGLTLSPAFFSFHNCHGVLSDIL